MIYECLTCNRQFLKSNGTHFEGEIEDEKQYRGIPVSHGYCSRPCFEHYLTEISELPQAEIELILKETYGGRK